MRTQFLLICILMSLATLGAVAGAEESGPTNEPGRAAPEADEAPAPAPSPEVYSCSSSFQHEKVTYTTRFVLTEDFQVSLTMSAGGALLQSCSGRARAGGNPLRDRSADLGLNWGGALSCELGAEAPPKPIEPAGFIKIPAYHPADRSFISFSDRMNTQACLVETIDEAAFRAWLLREFAEE